MPCSFIDAMRRWTRGLADLRGPAIDLYSRAIVGWSASTCKDFTFVEPCHLLELAACRDDLEALGLANRCMVSWGRVDGCNIGPSWIRAEEPYPKC